LIVVSLFVHQEHILVLTFLLCGSRVNDYRCMNTPIVSSKQLSASDSAPLAAWYTHFHVHKHVTIGHFQIVLCLFLKARPRAKPFIWKWVLSACEWKETHFHIKGYAPRLALRKRHKATQKWPISSYYLRNAFQWETLKYHTNDSIFFTKTLYHKKTLF